MSEQIVHIYAGGDADVWPQMKAGDILIGVDAGAIRLLDAGLTPTVAIGDFDTVDSAQLARLTLAGIPLERFPTSKDETDSELAVLKALSYQPKEIIMYGALGGRLDHSMANIQLLWRAHQEGVQMRIESRQNSLQLLSPQFPYREIKKGRHRYISLLPLQPPVTGITLDGFLFPLHNATLRLGSTLGISNQLVAESGTIQMETGVLLVIETSDLN